MKNIHEDLSSLDLGLPEARDLAQKSASLETDVFAERYALVVVVHMLLLDGTPYTITTIITVTTGRNHTYSVNFAVVFLAFASGLVDPIVCVVVNRDFWRSFKALVGLRRRQLLREAARAFAEAAACGESGLTARHVDQSCPWVGLGPL